MGDVDREHAFWERSAAQYDRVTTGLFGRPLPRARELTAHAVSGARAVLEVAAGTGLFTVAIAPRVGRVVATDYAEQMLMQLRGRLQRAGITNVETASRDIYDLRYPAGCFDAVVAANVLHLVPDLDRAVEALCEVLEPGGMLITPTFAHDETRTSRLISRVLGSAVGQPMHRRFTTATLRRTLENRRLVVTASETIAGPIPIAYVESRLLG